MPEQLGPAKLQPTQLIDGGCDDDDDNEELIAILAAIGVRVILTVTLLGALATLVILGFLALDRTE